MVRQHHVIGGAIALAAALTLSLAAAAWADPASLAKAEATIAAGSQSCPPVRPNPNDQPGSGATANPGPCAEVCSGGAASYRPASLRYSTPDESGATLPDGPRSIAAARLYRTASTPPTVVRVSLPNSGFSWGDAGIGAAGGFALSMLCIGGALAIATHRPAVGADTQSTKKR
jgi:hypothetical protein